MAETSTKPYLVRALYEWCCDNGYTPYLAVSVDADTRVPMQYVKGGEIVLNISPAATNRLTMNNDRIEFQARFSGVAQQLSIPVGNVTAIYARETGHGMAFDVTRLGTGDDAAASAPAPSASADDDDTTAARSDGSTSGAEVIAFGPDAARRRRRGGGRGRREAADGDAGGPGAAADRTGLGLADGRTADEPAADAAVDPVVDPADRLADAAADRSPASPRHGGSSDGRHGWSREDLATRTAETDVADDAPRADGPASDRGSATQPRVLAEVTDATRPAERLPTGRPAPQSKGDPTTVATAADGDGDDSGAEPVPADGGPEPRPPESVGAGKGRRSPRLTRIK